MTTGGNNIGIGQAAGSNVTAGSNCIEIGNYGSSGDDEVIRIGEPSVIHSTFIQGISGVTASGGVAVYVNPSGQLGILTSSRRFKSNIKDIGADSDYLMQLRPVSFRYKVSAEKGPHLKQYGLIAEEDAKVLPELVQYDKQGKPFTVYYQFLTPLMLNELQMQRRQVVSQKTTVAALRGQVAAQKLQISVQKQQIAGITQKYDTQLAALRVSVEEQQQLITQLASLVRSQQGGQHLENTGLSSR